MYVYWWHVRGLNAVKVGHAEDPRQHASDCRREYGLGGKDVRGYKLDSGTDAGWVESQLCRMLEARGLRRITLESENGEDEFFALDDRTFEDAHERLRDAARHIAFAEVSNRRKQQMRQELKAAPPPRPAAPPPPRPAAPPRPQAPRPDRTYQEPPPRQHRPAPSSRSLLAVQLGLFFIGAFVLWGVVTALRGDDPASDLMSANLTEPKKPLLTTAPDHAHSRVAPLRSEPCILVEVSDTLVEARCAGSWALMRWKGRWEFDIGTNESAALEFFNASDVARRIAAVPSQEPAAQVPKQVEVERERPPAPNKPAAPATPPPQLPPQQAASRPAAAPPQQQPREPTLPRQQCTVSRPQPGFQVYLVTCPNSQAMIGRTVDLESGWTISESVNGTEAIEFFMKSRYAR